LLNKIYKTISFKPIFDPALLLTLILHEVVR